MRGVLDELHQKYHVEVEYINVRENPHLARERGIRFTPVLIMFDRSGREISTNRGTLTAERIVSIFAESNVRLLPR